jgi:hypothetical protein
LEAAQVEALPPFSRVELEVATRQFGAALDTYEEIILDPDVSPADLALNNVFENYLKISIGAMANTQRPAATLQKFASSPGVPANLKKEATRWVEALNALDLSAPAGKELPTARALIEDAVQNTDPPSDRSYLVEFITSIALLHRYLATHPTDDLRISEAYYLLGLAESYVARSYWISETAFLLEKSIRQAPQSESARQALELLEEYTETSYRITPARSVPPELQTNLDELRALTQQ